MAVSEEKAVIKVSKIAMHEVYLKVVSASRGISRSKERVLHNVGYRNSRSVNA